MNLLSIVRKCKQRFGEQRLLAGLNLTRRVQHLHSRQGLRGREHHPHFRWTDQHFQGRYASGRRPKRPPLVRNGCAQKIKQQLVNSWPQVTLTPSISLRDPFMVSSHDSPATITKDHTSASFDKRPLLFTLMSDLVRGQYNKASSEETKWKASTLRRFPFFTPAQLIFPHNL